MNKEDLRDPVTDSRIPSEAEQDPAAEESAATTVESEKNDTADLHPSSAEQSTCEGGKNGSFLGRSIVLKTSHLLIGLCVTALLITGSIFLGMWISNRPSDPDIDPNAKDYGDIYVSAGEVAPGSISAPGYSDVTFLAGVRDVQIILPNPEGNPCYFRFILILQESGETIYRSGLVPPGQAITDITLSRPLEAGLYPMEIRIETFSLETRSAMSGVTMDVNLTVR